MTLRPSETTVTTEGVLTNQGLIEHHTDHHLSEAAWVKYADRLEEMVKWLAMTYGDNVPVFATALPDGTPLTTGIMLEALYKEVVGHRDWQPSSGYWVQCTECSTMYVHHADLSEPSPFCGYCEKLAQEYHAHRNPMGRGHVALKLAGTNRNGEEVWEPVASTMEVF